VGGALAHVQLKQLDPNGRLKRTSSHRDLVGHTATFTLPGFGHGNRIQVQANVTGIDPNRTDVVTVEEAVKLRPDLTVARIEHLPSVGQLILTQVVAFIGELNGDLGARATCILEVDGQQVDRAPGLWVDAGREVACGFLYRFAETGTRNITVRVTDVVPGDYSLANNARSSTISITEPIPVPTDNDFAWDGRVTGAGNRSGFTRGEGWYQDLSAGVRYDFTHFANQEAGGFLSTSMGGSTPRSLHGPVSIRFRDWVDATVIHDDQFNESTDQRSHYQNGDMRQECAASERTVELSSENGPFTATLARLVTCTSWRENGPDLGTWFSYFQSSGDVTYYAESWWREVGPGYELSYSFNGPVDRTHGILAFGGTYGFEFVFTAGTERLVASGLIPIGTEERHEVSPWQCSDYDDGVYSERSCFESETRYTAYSGIGTAIPNR
jgi:hypothetical protein